MKIVHRNIRKRRLACNYTQAYVASCLGISVKQLGDIERGKARIYLSMLEKIANTLETEITVLLELPSPLPPHVLPVFEQYLRLAPDEQELIGKMIQKMVASRYSPAES